jgi:hypothetical protein
MLRARYGNVNRVLTEKKAPKTKTEWAGKKLIEKSHLEVCDNVEKVENVEKRGKNLSFSPPFFPFNLTPLRSSD